MRYTQTMYNGMLFFYIRVYFQIYLTGPVINNDVSSSLLLQVPGKFCE